MHAVVFKLAVAVIVAAAIIFLLAATFADISESSNASVGNVEAARRMAMNRSVEYLLQ